MQSDVYVKLLFLGNEGVGKTAIIRAMDYLNNPSNNQYFNLGEIDKIRHTSSTIGAEFSSVSPQRYKKIKFNIWDTSGRERCRLIIPSYFKNADIFLLTFDTNNVKDFESMSYWIDMIKLNANGYVMGREPPIILIANKADKNVKSQISDEKIDLLVEHNSSIVAWIKTSIFDKDKIYDLERIIANLAVRNGIIHPENELYCQGELYQDETMTVSNKSSRNTSIWNLYKTVCFFK